VNFRPLRENFDGFSASAAKFGQPSISQIGQRGGGGQQRVLIRYIEEKFTSV